jgi:hypothetical protein
MSFSQTQIPQFPTITTPSSVANQHLTPPPTDEKQFAQVYRVIALFEEIRTGRHIDQQPWTEFWLAEGDYDEVERHLELDEELWGYVKDKIRCAYAGKKDKWTVANNRDVAGMITVEKVTVLLFECLQLYTNCSSLALRMPYSVN